MNQWNFIGRLGGDAEQRVTASGTPILQFSVAVDVGYGERKSTTWVRCSMFGERGAKIAPYALKGDRIGVTGEASLNVFTARDGTEKTSLEVRVNDVTLLGDHSKGDPKEHRPKEVVHEKPQYEAKAATTARGGGDWETEIPFDQFDKGVFA